MIKDPYSFCHYCGHSMENMTTTPDGYKCAHCGETTWMNSVGVAVLIAPCGIHYSGRENSVFIQQRGIPPEEGKWALPSGYIMKGESWQAAACREAYEEIGLLCRHEHTADEKPEHILTANSSEKTMIVVVGAVRLVFHIEPFIPNNEVLQRGILFPDDEEQLCFPIHRKALAMYWDKLGVTHNIKLTSVK